jgi:hypothetical protein
MVRHPSPPGAFCGTPLFLVETTAIMPLSTAADVERFADLLTQCADAAHQRLISAIRSSEITPATAQRIFETESSLRQHANNLYMDAANFIIAELQDTQINLNEVINEARLNIEKIKRIAHFIDMVSDLHIVASSVYTAKPGPLLAAIQEIQNDLQNLNS